MTCCYTQRSFFHSAHIREASASTRWELTQLAVSREWETFGALSPKWNDFIKPLPSELREACGREGRKSKRGRDGGHYRQTVSSGHTGQFHRWTNGGYDSIGKKHTRSRMTSLQHGDGRWFKVPFLTKELLAIVRWVDRESQFSLRV